MRAHDVHTADVHIFRSVEKMLDTAALHDETNFPKIMAVEFLCDMPDNGGEVPVGKRQFETVFNAKKLVFAVSQRL